MMKIAWRLIIPVCMVPSLNVYKKIYQGIFYVLQAVVTHCNVDLARSSVKTYTCPRYFRGAIQRYTEDMFESDTNHVNFNLFQPSTKKVSAIKTKEREEKKLLGVELINISHAPVEAPPLSIYP